ncbi:NAD(P)H-binding protein [Ideonella sp.]|uniref:NAD(P)H-binding protein n=1 Tax=Ideonella sp. TaxID=1929293 RepID=UPI00351BC5F9
MKVLLLGATGGTGREIVKRATAKGHSVVAVVRSIAKAGDMAGATLVEGDARDDAVLASAGRRRRRSGTACGSPAPSAAPPS